MTWADVPSFVVFLATCAMIVFMVVQCVKLRPEYKAANAYLKEQKRKGR